MLIEITCARCHHRGHVPQDMLPRLLSCSGCGRIARFDHGKVPHTDARRAPPVHFAETKVDESTPASMWEGDANDPRRGG